ncbi:MAG TPA: hypothetical protein DCE41_35430, partial [Cytophagales bacterium]|nr:hypothetical protein [Cytophagales bacterium]
MATQELPTRISEAASAAAGTKAVVNAGRMALKVMNPWKTLQLASKLNQKGGIDCPGCAWPDP